MHKIVGSVFFHRASVDIMFNERVIKTPEIRQGRCSWLIIFRCQLQTESVFRCNNAHNRTRMTDNCAMGLSTDLLGITIQVALSFYKVPHLGYGSTSSILQRDALLHVKEQSEYYEKLGADSPKSGAEGVLRSQRFLTLKVKLFQTMEFNKIKYSKAPRNYYPIVWKSCWFGTWFPTFPLYLLGLYSTHLIN